MTMSHKTRPTFVVSTRSIWKKLILLGVLVELLLAPSIQSAESVSAPPHTSSISTAPSLSAQGYPSGQHPFMVNKMFVETYQAPLWLNSYFDHKLPIQTDEFLSKIPADLRDTTTTTNFL